MNSKKEASMRDKCNTIQSIFLFPVIPPRLLVGGLLGNRKCNIIYLTKLSTLILLGINVKHRKKWDGVIFWKKFTPGKL